jgi:guanine deaminase
MCLGAIYWARLSAVYYACNRLQASTAGFDDGFIYEEIPKLPAKRTIGMYLLSLTNPEKPFQTWHSLKDKICY